MNNATTGSATAGSPATGPAINLGFSGASAGEPNKVQEATVPEKQYKELESKFGTQGQELGEYRQFFQSVSPLLEKLDQNPELVQAILDGKIDKELSKAVLEGKVSVADAAVVTAAHDQVKKELGSGGYKAAAPEDINKLVDEKMQVIRKEIEERSELDRFQRDALEFIEKTPDFKEFAEDIDKWLDEHDVTDISVAYYAVKGQLGEAAAKKAAEAAAGERAKEMAMNASGGGINSRYAPDGTPTIDRLVAGRTDPNRFF